MERRSPLRSICFEVINDYTGVQSLKVEQLFDKPPQPLRFA
jgi:hypothetical protein